MEKKSLNSALDYASLSLEDVRRLYDMKEKEILLSNYNLPEKPSTDGYFHIFVKDASKKSGRKQIKDKTLDGLKEKIILHEKGMNGSARKTFKDLHKIVLENKLLYIKSREKLVSVKNTCTKIDSEYRRYFSGTEFERKYIDEITKKDIENVCLGNLKKYDLRKKAFLSLRGILKSVFDYAYSEYLINDNIYQRVDFKKFQDMLDQDVPVEKRAHSSDDIIKILDELHRKQQSRPKLTSAWALEMQILMGMRRGEIPPLEWSDISEKKITISKEQLTEDGNEFVIVGHTKNYKNRYFPITNDLTDFLTRLKAMHDKYYPNSKYLFPADNKNGIITNRAVYSVYQKICKKRGIEKDEGIILGPHSFRRNAITDVVNATNGNIIMASALFGNTPEVAKQNYYTGTNLTLAKEVLDARKLK